jgi:hypothetical protein
MKKLMSLIVCLMFTTAMVAQTTNSSDQATTNPGHEYYMLKDGKLYHSMGDKSTAVTESVTLKNGTMISTTGEVTMKDGSKQTLTADQCISLSGRIGACADMPGMKKQNKMDEKSDKKSDYK